MTGGAGEGVEVGEGGVDVALDVFIPQCMGDGHQSHFIVLSGDYQKCEIVTKARGSCKTQEETVQNQTDGGVGLD